MKCLAASIVFIFSASLFAQQAGVQTASLRSQAKPGVISDSASTSRPDLGVLLADLERITGSTRNDISGLQIEKWKSGWQTGWLKRGSNKQEAKQLASSLKNNLTEAMPGLISEAQDSRGSMSATFKLYKDLSAVVECVGSLEEMAVSFGRKQDSAPLHSDYTALGRIRQDLASFIQVTADTLEPVDRTPRPGSPAYGAVLSASKRAPHRISTR